MKIYKKQKCLQMFQELKVSVERRSGRLNAKIFNRIPDDLVWIMLLKYIET